MTTRITIKAGRMDAATIEAVEALESHPRTFDFGSNIVVVQDGKIYSLNVDSLKLHLGQSGIRFERFKVSERKMMDCDPPDALVKQVLAYGERRDLKKLQAVITAPTIRLDGTVLSAAGFDPDTGLFLDPAGQILAIPDKPTLEQAKDAVIALLKPFLKFPFVDGLAEAALLSALLTAVVRPVLSTAPAFAFDAPVQGSGKTLLALSVGALAEGYAPAVWPHTKGRDDEETRKRLLTALSGGQRVLIWDNIVGQFDSASLAAAITSETFTDRILQKTESITVPNRALVLLTGNNLCLSGDMPRRVLICRIDPKSEEPFARSFDIDPKAHVLSNRMRMVAAACTLIRARFVHPFTLAEGKTASFEAWDSMVRQSVIFCRDALGWKKLGDPMDLFRAAQDADPDRDDLGDLLDALQQRFGSEWFDSKEVAQAAEVSGDIKECITAICGDKPLSSKAVGKVLAYRKDRIARGLAILVSSSGKKAARYRIERKTTEG